MIDYNHMHVTGSSEEVMTVEPLEDRLRSFGWQCVTVDGHDVESILAGFGIRKHHADSPFPVICTTVKGKGVDFMENNVDWHANVFEAQQRERTVAQLSAALAAIR